jgi:hypothetical protein
MNDRPSLYRNEGGNRSHWITLRLEGARSNRDAIGARVEIWADGKRQVHEVPQRGSYLSHNDMRLHFGLGSTSRVDRIRIRWARRKYRGTFPHGCRPICDDQGKVGGFVMRRFPEIAPISRLILAVIAKPGDAINRFDKRSKRFPDFAHFTIVGVLRF